MPHKLLERQYQLQAQKRHEEHLRQDYYRQTARYFEREAAAARQFHSWSTKGPECYSDRVEKLRKAEQLKNRQEKLRRLLLDENEKYAKELEEQKRTRRRSNESVTLEELRQKLMEKRAEQSLYYPNACRRLRSYSSSPADMTKKLETLGIANNGSDSVRPVSRHSYSHKRFSTSPSLEKALYYDYEENINDKNKKILTPPSRYAESPKSSRMSENGLSNNLRFAARRYHQSLGETNLRNDNNQHDTLESSKNQKNNDFHLLSSKQQCEELNRSNHTIEEHKDDNGNASEVNEDQLIEERLLQCNGNGTTNGSVENNKSLSKDVEELKSCEVEVMEPLRTEIAPNTENDETDYVIEDDDADKYRRGNMRQKEADVAGDANISVKMYRYLKHNDLNRQILDLAKREHTFVIKQSFDEALRLREMRNELILLKNKNLYENEDLKISEQTRAAGLKVVEERNKLNEQRTKMRNTILYSDEAKDLWKQWVREDDTLANMETNAARDLVLQDLENEWQSLALGDKNRISQLYDKIMTKSDLQNEHKLAAVLRAANDGQKQYMNYLAK